jgi:hypothetical protein
MVTAQAQTRIFKIRWESAVLNYSIGFSTRARGRRCMATAMAMVKQA